MCVCVCVLLVFVLVVLVLVLVLCLQYGWANGVLSGEQARCAALVARAYIPARAEQRRGAVMTLAAGAQRDRCGWHRRLPHSRMLVMQVMKGTGGAIYEGGESATEGEPGGV